MVFMLFRVGNFAGGPELHRDFLEIQVVEFCIDDTHIGTVHEMNVEGVTSIHGFRDLWVGVNTVIGKSLYQNTDFHTVNGSCGGEERVGIGQAIARPYKIFTVNDFYFNLSQVSVIRIQTSAIEHIRSDENAVRRRETV